MDRKTTIGYILIFAILVFTFYLNQQNAGELEQANRTRDSLEIVKKNKAISEKAATPIVSSDTTTSNIAPSIDSVPEQKYSIENANLKIALTNKGGKIAGILLKGIKTFYKKDLYLLNNPNDTFNYKIYTTNGSINTSDLTFTPVSTKSNAMILQAPISGGGIVKMIYELKPNSYNLKYSMQLENCASQIPQSQNFIDFKWVSHIGLLERTVEDEQATTTVFYKYKTDDDVEKLSESKSEDKKLQKGIEWVSYKQKFFNTTLINRNGFTDVATISVEKPDDAAPSSIKRMSSSFVLPYTFKPVEKYDFEFYIGTNHYPTLTEQKISLEKIISLGFFGWVSKLALIPLFNLLADFIANFGLVILCLTLIIKLCLFPLVYKSYVSSAKMRVLKPEIDEIKAKYGTDMTRMQQENMKLYKRAGVNPMGGCIPMLLQLPILLAMFNFFPASYELRQKAFLWASDLSSYDSIVDLGFHIPGYGSHISLFTLLMTVSTLLYTRMNNQLTGVSGQMKWISYLMPILFLGFFNNYASGLTYYYFLGNMITFGQNVLIRKFFVDEAKLHKQIEENKKKPVVIKKSGFQKRLEEIAKKNEARNPKKK
jgi:YidC/Oxa1 family membrane protein insertase